MPDATKTTLSMPFLFHGARVRMSRLGRERHPKYGDREGLIVGRGTPSSWRVKFDDRKTIQAIHRDYLELAVPPAGASPQAPSGASPGVSSEVSPHVAAQRDLQLYILINNKVEPEFQLVPNSTIEIAARSSSTIVKTQTRSILFSTWDFTRRNKFGFNLTYIEGRVPAAARSGFDTAYMRGLFQYGYERARSGQAWSKTPPSDALNPTASYRTSTAPQTVAAR